MLRREQVLAEWRSLPLGPGQCIAVVCGVEAAWRPLDPWQSGTPQEAIAVLEKALREDLGRHFRPESTVAVWMRSWEGALVEGAWRHGVWVGGPVLRPQVVSAHRPVLAATVPPVRRRRRM